MSVSQYDLEKNAQRLGKRTFLYQGLNLGYQVVVVVLGAFAARGALRLYGGRLDVRFHVGFLVAYVLLDLVRVRFTGSATISLGFSVLLLDLLICQAKRRAQLPGTWSMVVLGSLISEFLWCSLPFLHYLPWPSTRWRVVVPDLPRWRGRSRLRRPVLQSLGRALFYAAHHALAGLLALLAFEQMSQRPDILSAEDDTFHLVAPLAYVVTYAVVSMSLVWPHDWQFQRFLLSRGEKYVRVGLLTTPLLVPFTIAIFYYYDRWDFGSDWERYFVLGLLSAGLIVLVLVAYYLVMAAQERRRLRERDRIDEDLRQASNMTEMAKSVVEIVGNKVVFDSCAVYGWTERSSARDEAGWERKYWETRGSDRERIDSGGGSDGTATAEAPAEDDAENARDIWPDWVSGGTRVLADLVNRPPHVRFLDRPSEADALPTFGLSSRSALIAFPIPRRDLGGETGRQELGLEEGAARQGLDPEAERVPRQVTQIQAPGARVAGFLVLTRRWAPFTAFEQEQCRELCEVGERFTEMLRADQQAHNLLAGVLPYTSNAVDVQLRIQELIKQNVPVDRILQVIRENLLQDNLSEVLENLAEGRTEETLHLSPEEVRRAYERAIVDTAAASQPEPNRSVLASLRAIISSLPQVFGLGSVVDRRVYRCLSDAQRADTVGQIASLRAQISAVAGIEGQADVLKIVRMLRDIVAPLEQYGSGQNPAVRATAVTQALEILDRHRSDVRGTLGRSSNQVFRQITSAWRDALHASLAEFQLGPADLELCLSRPEALLLDETHVGLDIRNRGQGPADDVVAELTPRPEYEVLEGVVQAGAIGVGEKQTALFALKPKEDERVPVDFSVRWNDSESRDNTRSHTDRLRLRRVPPYRHIDNPYTPGPPLEPGVSTTFASRDDIFDFIRQNLVDTSSRKILALIGGRRMGKTSILKHLSQKLDGERFIPVFVNCQAFVDPGLDSFFQSLSLDISQELEKFGIHVPRLTSADLEEGSRQAFEGRFLRQVRRQLGREQVVLLALDEFDYLGQLVQEQSLPRTVFPYLRHLMQHEPQLAFILAGTHSLEESISRHSSEFFNVALSKRVGRLDRAAAEHLIRTPVEPSGVVYDDLAVDEIVRLVSCHPYFTQMLCDLLMKRCNEKKQLYVAVRDVHAAERQLLDEGSFHLNYIRDTADPTAKLFMAALTDLLAHSERVTLDNIIERLASQQEHPGRKRLRLAAERLVTEEFVREVPGSPVSYQFTAQLYVHWLRRNYPLDTAMKEVRDERQD